MMTSAVRCIFILACTAILTSSGDAKTKCRCLSSGNGARAPLRNIVSAKVYPVRPHCNRKEVIITLTNGRKMCLDPTERYTKTVLRGLKPREAAKNRIATTTAAPGTETQTETVTASETVKRQQRRQQLQQQLLQQVLQQVQERLRERQQEILPSRQ